MACVNGQRQLARLPQRRSREARAPLPPQRRPPRRRGRRQCRSSAPPCSVTSESLLTALRGAFRARVALPFAGLGSACSSRCAGGGNGHQLVGGDGGGEDQRMTVAMAAAAMVAAAVTEAVTAAAAAAMAVAAMVEASGLGWQVAAGGAVGGAGSRSDGGGGGHMGTGCGCRWREGLSFSPAGWKAVPPPDKIIIVCLTPPTHHPDICARVLHLLSRCSGHAASADIWMVIWGHHALRAAVVRLSAG